MVEGKSKGRRSKEIPSSTVNAQEFALEASGQEKLESTEGILQAVISVRITAKVQAQG